MQMLVMRAYDLSTPNRAIGAQVNRKEPTSADSGGYTPRIARRFIKTMNSLSAHRDPRVKVLVADDERVIADTLRAILNQNGFEAASAYGGQDAVDMARVWPPDILLTDVTMPGLNGIESAIQIVK
jgi:PleD family two-component response regulator